MKKKKVKRKLKKKPIIILIIIVLILIFIGLIICYLVNNKEDEIKEVKVLNSIDKYNYVLNDNDTKLYEKEFNNLVSVLKKSEINNEDYASSVSKLFALDFYDLKSKVINTDVGGTQFIYKDNLDNFLINAKDTIYKNIETNYDGKRKQELPSINEVEVKSVEESTFKVKEKDYDSYEVEVKIDYVKDLGYNSNILVTLILNNNKLEIVKVK